MNQPPTNFHPARLSDRDYAIAAEMLQVDVATVRAVCAVEAAGSGFLPDGRPKILFEGHIFWKRLKANGCDPMKHAPGNEDILYPTWTKKHYVGGAGEYGRLDRAEKIDVVAANESASWGMFQIMGFNYGLCGYDHVYDFAMDMGVSEGKHLLAFCGFVKRASSGGKALVAYLRARDWAGFARGYNGPGYQANQYDVKLAKAYTRARKEGAVA